MLTTWVLCVRQTRCLSIKIYVYGIKIHSYLRYIFCSPAFITYSRSWIEKRVPALHFQRRDAVRMCVCACYLPMITENHDCVRCSHEFSLKLQVWCGIRKNYRYIVKRVTTIGHLMANIIFMYICMYKIRKKGEILKSIDISHSVNSYSHSIGSIRFILIFKCDEI